VDAVADGDPAEVLYEAEVSARAPGGPDKHVRFAVDSSEAVMGMSGSLAEFYGAEAGTFTPRPSTLDYVVGALTGCLLGTFRRALAARDITVTGAELTAEGVGQVVIEAGVPVLRNVTVRYRLSAPADADRAVIERAHAVHHQACAVSRSLQAAIEISTELELV
jgi:uncharacterized OsmC-like protein